MDPSDFKSPVLKRQLTVESRSALSTLSDLEANISLQRQRVYEALLKYAATGTLPPQFDKLLKGCDSSLRKLELKKDQVGWPRFLEEDGFDSVMDLMHGDLVIFFGEMK